MCAAYTSLYTYIKQIELFFNELLKPIAYRSIIVAQFYRFSFIFNSGLFIFYWITYFMTLKPWTKSNSCPSCVFAASDKYKHTNHRRLDFIEGMKRKKIIYLFEVFYDVASWRKLFIPEYFI